ncbi:response regulator [Sinorhizobium medicae]|uniref:response regulator n=1 Tax=Sinorhizobium medicae TaxID=110321 RepID=UPI000FD75F0E|nr:response regulator [Sinorhizobium medicae]MDX0509819.1 response regulator [Sinorhizobium medicae]MDX0921384.1 response regulator [Sinorhizobium medicae]MDX0935257.1 response regulator [Sinorhizobium medicae]MDX0941604.1 response regulator [Sinorhizobium medicae]MDX1027632.1 response regulator [Sinorhizobium medicae]
MVGKSENGRFLQGLRVLVVEDEVWIALDLEAAFVDVGAQVVGPCGTLETALVAAKNEALALAVLDIRLGTATTERVIDLLNERGIPFFFYSGQTLPDEMRKKSNGAVVMVKPAMQQDIVGKAVEVLMASGMPISPS